MVERRVREIVGEQLGLEDKEVKLDSLFKEDLGADSLDSIELVLAIEDEFGVEIHEEEAEKMKQVKDVVEWLKKNI